LYTDKDWPVFAYHYAGRWQKVPYAQHITQQWAADYLADIWKRHEGIWLVVTPYAAINDPQGWVPRWLQEHALAIDEHRFADKILRLYARTEQRASGIGMLGTHAPVPEPSSGRLTPGIQLVGYEQAVTRVRPGDTVHLFLRWQEQEEPAMAPGFALLLVDRAGSVIEEEERNVLDTGKAQEMVRQQIDLVVPSDAPEGRYRFLVRSLDGREISEFGELCVVAEEMATLGPGDVTISHPYEVVLGDRIWLLGYDLSATTIPAGSTIELTLYWRADASIEQRYKVFTHVLGETFNARTESFLWGQQDNEPVSDTRPTPTWRPGEVIVDRYAIPIDGEAPAGLYAVEIGMYDPATGTRLPVLGRDGSVVADHIVLLSIRVAPE
jgi:hypothetical protein